MGPVYFVRLYPSSPNHHGSVWLLPVIPLLLANTVSRVRVCQSIWLERFRGSQKKDELGPLSIFYFMVMMFFLKLQGGNVRELTGHRKQFIILLYLAVLHCLSCNLLFYMVLFYMVFQYTGYYIALPCTTPQRTYRGRDEIGWVYLPSQLERRHRNFVRDGRAPPAHTSQGWFFHHDAIQTSNRQLFHECNVFSRFFAL